MGIRAVVFDLDDCLIETFGPSCDNLVEVATLWNVSREPRLSIPPKDRAADIFASHYNSSWEGWITGVWPELHGYTAEFGRFYLGNLPGRKFPAVPGAHEAVQVIRSGGYATGMLSGRDRSLLGVRLAEAGFAASDFGFVCSTHDCGYSKPDPRAFGGAVNELKRLGMKPEDAIYVGDQASDRGCEGAGLKFVAVCTGVLPREYFLGCGMGERDVLSSVAHLTGYLGIP